jgi:hypothetical protein
MDYFYFNRIRDLHSQRIWDRISLHKRQRLLIPSLQNKIHEPGLVVNVLLNAKILEHV